MLLCLDRGFIFGSGGMEHVGGRRAVCGGDELEDYRKSRIITGAISVETQVASFYIKSEGPTSVCKSAPKQTDSDKRRTTASGTTSNTLFIFSERASLKRTYILLGLFFKVRH